MNLPSYYITAYGLAVDRGFKGSIEDWLYSLNGHVHIKYADRLPQSDAEMKDVPGDYIGIYADRTADDSPRHRDYQWHCIKGAANAAVIAPVFVSGLQYHYSDIVSYGDRVYRCLQDFAGEAPTAPAWAEETLGEALTALGLPYGVAYVEQQLNAEQQRIARENIGAMADGDFAVKSRNIEQGAVTEEKLGTGAVTNTKLGAGAVESANIKDGAVTAAKIPDGEIGGGKLAAGAVTAEKLGAGAVETAAIKDRAVNGSKLALDNGDLGAIILSSNIHYFESEAALPTPTRGRIAFVKSGG